MERSFTVQLRASAASVANSTAFSLSTGSAPGRPRQTGQMLVLGSEPNRLAQPQKALVAVRSCTWTSSPITGSYLAMMSGDTAAAADMVPTILRQGKSVILAREDSAGRCFCANCAVSCRQTSYSAGSSAVKGEQHGFSVAWKFISSARIPSGSYILNWYLPSLPILGP